MTKGDGHPKGRSVVRRSQQRTQVPPELRWQNMYTTPIDRTASKRPRRWLRVSLRTFLILFTLTCVLIGRTTYRANQQRLAVDAVGQFGYVIYQHESPIGAKRINYKAEPPGPRWCRKLIGNDFFQEVRRVDFRPTDESMAHLSKLRDVRQVTIDASQLTDDGLRYLTSLPKLERLTIVNGHGLTNGAFYHIGQIESLNRLNVDNVPIDGEVIVDLKNLRGLKTVQLYRTFLEKSDFEMLTKTFSRDAVFGYGTYDRFTEFYSIQMRSPNGRNISTNDELTRRRRLISP